MNPLSRSSCNWFINSFIYDGASRYGDLAIGAAPVTKSILNSTWRGGGNPGRSSGNTFGYSQTMGTSSNFFFSGSVLIMYAKNA